MGKGKNWAADELEYLESNWGQRSITAIAEHLGRSVNAVRIIAQRHGLTRWLHSGEFITLNQLMIALGKGKVYTFQRELWLQNGFPLKHRKAVCMNYNIVYLEDFWAWAEQHKNLIDLSLVEPLSLGQEPMWAEAKRKTDQLVRPFRMRDWTPVDDAQLKAMVKQQRYGYAELSHALQRTEGAVKRRICTLGLRERPVPATDKPWTEQEVTRLRGMLSLGYSYELIGEKLDRSALACRGKVERLQNPDAMKRWWRRQKEKERGAQG